MELLLNATQQVLGHFRLTNGASRQIQEFVSVVVDMGEELSHTRLRPISTNDGKDLSQNVRPT